MTSIPEDQLPPGAVRRVGQWADMSKGTVDADGCLVCPWHQSTYDVHTGQMVRGPRGLFGYHRPTPRYAALVRAYCRVLRLRVGTVVRRGRDLDVS